MGAGVRDPAACGLDRDSGSAPSALHDSAGRDWTLLVDVEVDEQTASAAGMPVPRGLAEPGVTGRVRLPMRFPNAHSARVRLLLLHSALTGYAGDAYTPPAELVTG